MFRNVVKPAYNSPKLLISNFHLIFWLHNTFDVIIISTKNVLFLETNKNNQFMQFTIDLNIFKLLFIHLVLTQYGCLLRASTFSLQHKAACLSFKFPYKEVSRFWKITVLQTAESLIWVDGFYGYSKYLKSFSIHLYKPTKKFMISKYQNTTFSK